MGIPLMVLIGIMSRIVGRKWYKVVDENGEIVDVAPENIAEYARISSQATVPELDPNESYPSVVMSFAPIFVPVILILASTFTSMMYKGDPTPVTEIIGFLGSPVIAISISLLVSIYGLAGNKSRQEVLDCLERGVKSCGTVILITGAGGAFGNIIKSSGIGDVIANGLASANMPILLLPFLMAAILKLVLGSGTVAMTTTATICAPILMQIPGANMMYCATQPASALRCSRCTTTASSGFSPVPLSLISWMSDPRLRGYAVHLVLGWLWPAVHCKRSVLTEQQKPGRSPGFCCYKKERILL